MIAQGVRFNAEKKQIGNYYSTKAGSHPMVLRRTKHCNFATSVTRTLVSMLSQAGAASLLA